MQLALREMTRLQILALMWALLTALAAVAGPFGTMEALGSLARMLYWGAVVGVSIAASAVAVRLVEGRKRFAVLLIWTIFVVLLSAGFHLVNTLVFSGWGNLVDWAYLTGTVGMVTVAVHVVLWIAHMGHPEQMPLADTQETFQRRLPYELRAPLVRIEAQDHYLNVVSTKGSALILMRLGDAIGELSGIGVQVHRSHWVALEGIERARRIKGRDVLVTLDGAEVPVSRSHRAAAQQAGLL